MGPSKKEGGMSTVRGHCSVWSLACVLFVDVFISANQNRGVLDPFPWWICLVLSVCTEYCTTSRQEERLGPNGT
jgi:hypothetical protein